MITLDATFTASMRMVHRIHGHAANRGTLAMPASPTRLAVSHILMIQVADLADRGHTVDPESPHFTRWQLHQSQIAFLTEQLGSTARGAHSLSALTRRKLEVMHLRAGGNEAQ